MMLPLLARETRPLRIDLRPLDDGRLDLALAWIDARDRWLHWSGRILDQAASLLPRARSHAARSERGAELPAGMSAWEVEVSWLVARGSSYADVGEALFISPRAAARHLRSISNTKFG